MRQYISTAHFNAPFEGAHYLSGLGQTSRCPGAAPGSNLRSLGAWPAGRSYWTTANFRAPYDHGYFQDNTLFGLGSIKEDVTVVFRQIPTWAFLLGGAGLSYLAYKGYTRKKKAA